MSSLRVLFIGGSGVISSACARQAVDDGIDLYVLNRGQSSARTLPAGVRELRADARNAGSVRDAIEGLEFDSVVDWVAFTPGHVQADIELFRGRTGQYVFISSASVYQTPPARLPVTESTPLRNPFWQYSRDKIACEDLLVHAYRDEGFPATIVRPSHTYDPTLMPFEGGWTVLRRMLADKPVAFHITSEDFLTWDQIAHALASALGVTATIVHVPSDAIAAVDPEWGASLLGDKAHSMVFDNAKIRSIAGGWRATVPFERGAREIAGWYLADASRQVADSTLDALMDKLADDFAVS